MVVDVGEFINGSILPKFRGATAADLIRMFKEKNIRLTTEEAQLLVQDVRALQKIDFRGHDTTGPHAKTRAAASVVAGQWAS